MAPVGLDVPRAAGKIQPFSVQRQAPLQRVPHADDAVGTLHAGDKPERAHDVRSEGRERPIAHRAVKGQSLPLHTQARLLSGKQALSHLNVKHLLRSAERRAGIFQPPGLSVCDDLKGCAAPSCPIDMKGGDEGEGCPIPGLMLQIPAFKIRPPLFPAVVIRSHFQPSAPESRT